MKKKLFVILLTFIMFSSKANAATFTVNGFSTDGTSTSDYSNFLPRYLYGNANSYVNDFFEVLFESTEITNFRTIKIQLCMPKNSYVEIRDYRNGQISNIDYLPTDAKCSIYSTNDANFIFAYIDVTSWTRWIQNSNIYYVPLYLKIGSRVGWNWTATINNVFVATENTYSDDVLMVQQGNSTAIIEQQNETIINIQQDIEDSIDDLNSNIMDDSIDSSSSSSFFSNFSTTDNGGISSVITAPLAFIRSMTNQCSPLTFTIFDQEINLPCGDTLFWGRSDVQTFANVWNVIVGGAFVYLLLVKMFKSIEDMKDPESDKVEVMKL